MNQLPRHLFAWSPSKSVCQDAAKIIEPKLDHTQSGFRRGRSATDQSFTLQNIFEKSWEYAKDVCTCFVDLGKVYGRVSREKLWGVLREYGVDGRLLLVIRPAKSFHPTALLLKEKTAEMGYLRRVLGVTLCDKEHRSEIRKARDVKALL